MMIMNVSLSWWYSPESVKHYVIMSFQCFNHSSSYFPILLAMYCRMTYNNVSSWLVNVEVSQDFYHLQEFMTTLQKNLEKYGQIVMHELFKTSAAPWKINRENENKALIFSQQTQSSYNNNSGFNIPLMAMVCQLTASLKFRCLEAVVNDHSASLRGDVWSVCWVP